MFLFTLILSGKNIRSLIKFDLINRFLLFYVLLLIISLFLLTISEWLLWGGNTELKVSLLF